MPLSNRSILLAVDGTDDSVAACIWMLDAICKPGDTVHLCHVICNDRVSPTSVGASGYGGYGGRAVMATMDEDFGMQRRKEYLQRKELDASNMMAQLFMPLLSSGQTRYHVELVVADGQRSAANIGQVIVKTADRLDADFMLIASHGTGLLADYGSVARYMTQNYKRPLILIPPRVDELAQRTAEGICCAVSSDAELESTTAFALQDLLKCGDTLNVLRVPQEKMVPQGAQNQPLSVADLESKIEESSELKEITLAVTELSNSGGSSGEDVNKQSAQLVLDSDMVANSRALVLVNYASQGMLQEMMLGSLATHCSRSSKLPLVLLPPGVY